MKIRIGHSKDVHRLETGEKLILGGVEIAHEKGLVGHSDADVLTHAITESIIGALGLGDIGTFFSDQDKKYLNISSLKLLKEIIDVMKSEGYKINNIDSTIFAERPHLKKYEQLMIENLCTICEVEQSAINIKATRGEKLGYIGNEEGMGAEAVVLLIKE